MAVKLNDDNLLSSLLPAAIKQDSKITNSAAAVNPWLLDLYKHLHDALYLYRLNELDSATLDHLAAQWNVTVWRDSWDLDLKRTALKNSILEKRRMGTLAAVKNVLGSFTDGTYITEWFEDTVPSNTPFTFYVVVDVDEIEGEADADTIDNVMASISEAKNVRSQFTMTIMRHTQAPVCLCANLQPWQTARIGVLDPKVKHKLTDRLHISAGMITESFGRVSSVKRNFSVASSLDLNLHRVGVGYTYSRISNI